MKNLGYLISFKAFTSSLNCQILLFILYKLICFQLDKKVSRLWVELKTYEINYQLCAYCTTWTENGPAQFTNCPILAFILYKMLCLQMSENMSRFWVGPNTYDSTCQLCAYYTTWTEKWVAQFSQTTLLAISYAMIIQMARSHVQMAISFVLHGRPDNLCLFMICRGLLKPKFLGSVPGLNTFSLSF